MIWKIGIIADTHGLLRPEALAAFEGVDHIIHAGDIGGREIITALETLSPVTVVRGNHDKGDWGYSLPTTDAAVFGDMYFYVVHDIMDLDLDPWEAQCRAVVSGHTHEPSTETRNGVVFLNPGAAGLRRSAEVAPTIAVANLSESTLDVEFRELPD
jgi:uncharacterized protein